MQENFSNVQPEDIHVCRGGSTLGLVEETRNAYQELCLLNKDFAFDMTGGGLRVVRTAPSNETYDQDGDGYTNIIDCDDTDATIYPTAQERCDEKDNDCNDIIDDNPSIAEWYTDSDGDGFGTGSPQYGCPASDYAFLGGDCNDTDPLVHPEAIEIVNNDIDDDCTGSDVSFVENDFVTIDVSGIEIPINGGMETTAKQKILKCSAMKWVVMILWISWAMTQVYTII